MQAVLSKADLRPIPNRQPDTNPSADKSGAPSADAGSLHSPLSTHLGMVMLYALVAGTLFQGWQHREDSYLTAESGLGYALGIVGGSLMLLLLLYPLRKRARFMRRWGPVRHWFRVHKLFGILGPLLVLFHANFAVGSLNSVVALVSMLLVAASGLIGRYLYTKIHRGLYGHRTSLTELSQESEVKRRNLEAVFEFAPQLKDRLQAYESEALAQRKSMLHGAAYALQTGIRKRQMRRVLLRDLRQAVEVKAQHLDLSGREQRWYRNAARRFVSDYLDAASRVAQFSFYERLFALWHILHLPLFFMLLIAGVAHVIAVHMY